MSRADSPTAVGREWRFKPERTHRIPPTWADNGRHEVPDDDQERYYAVQIKPGVSLQWGVDVAGEIVDGPHRDKPTVRVCYIALDGCSAFVRDWDAVLDGDGKATPERDFASVLAIDPDDADPVDDHSDRAFYRTVLQDRYDVTPVVADGGQSTGGTDRSWVNDIHQGDVTETLAEMPESSVHMAMTSPPYFGLRDYGVDGQIGLEKSLDEYIGELLNVGNELRRVLRDDGSWWLNLGDSFAGSGRGQWNNEDTTQKEAYTLDSGELPDQNVSLRRKSKMLVPHRVAIALEDAGWIVRSDAVWEKPNPMPHPVKDRLHEHKEFVFHLTPQPDYWFDLDAVRETHKESSLKRRNRYDYNDSGTPAGAYPDEQNRDGEYIGTEPEDALHPNGKNPGDIFEIAVKSFPEAHFAVYPPELCEAPIKSSCPPTVCSSCGTPYEFETSDADLLKNPNDRDKKTRALELYEQSTLTREHLEAARDVGLHDEEISNHESDGGYGKVDEETARLAEEARDVLGAYTREFFTGERKRTGWEQVCDCDTDEIQPGIVLDPFAGAGTTCMVAKELGRRFIGIDLNPDYVALAQKRAGVTVDDPERLLEDDAQTTLIQADGGRNDCSRDTVTDREGSQ